MNSTNAYDEKDTSTKKRVLLIVLIILALLCVFVSLYLMEYHIGTIGVSADIAKQLDVIFITSNSVGWNVLDELNIFCNSEFNNKNIIAPNSKGIYKFVVQNKSPNNIIYNLEFMEKNNHNINMKFRLKMDNIYMISSKDDWKNISDLNMQEVLIASNSKTMYSLEWYWEETQEDTKIGQEDYADYELYITFTPNLVIT